jgi:hypothetical protein
MEPVQLRTGLHADLLHERGARDTVRRERLRLAAAPVQREHPLRVEPLAQRVRGHERVELGDHVGVPARGQVGLDGRLGRARPQLLQPADLRSGERLVGDVGQRVAAPQRERLARLPARHEPLEMQRVDVAPVEPQLVPAATRRDHPAVAGERAAQVRHVGLDHLGRARRRRVTPQALGEPLRPDGLAEPEREHREDGSLLAGAEGDPAAVQERLRRP